MAKDVRRDFFLGGWEARSHCVALDGLELTYISFPLILPSLIWKTSLISPVSSYSWHCSAMVGAPRTTVLAVSDNKWSYTGKEKHTWLKCQAFFYFSTTEGQAQSLHMQGKCLPLSCMWESWMSINFCF